MLDLKTRGDLNRAQALARVADVIIENYRPGVADRLGIGYERLSEANAGLIYVSLPGYGEGHPRRNTAGWDSAIGAETGLFRPPEGASPPVFTPLPIPSAFAAILGSLSVAIALLARDQTGAGQRIEVSLHQAMFSAIGVRLTKTHDIEPGDGSANIGRLMSRQYQCGDGRWVQNHGLYERFVHQWLEASGRKEWESELIAFIRGPGDRDALAKWRNRFEEVFLERSAWDWEEDINAVGGACAVCRTVEEWLAHEHPDASRMVVEVDDVDHGPMMQPGVSVNLRGTPGGIRAGAPRLGDHQEVDASEAGTIGQDAVVRPVTSVLDGVRVLDLCIVLAGPTCGRALAEFGADVIIIHNPGRPSPPVLAVDVDRGKRSIMVDLKSAEGKQVFWDLVATADVIVQSHRVGALDRLGIGYEEVKKRRPQIIFTSINAYGHGGPWAERPGWEQLAQATSGMQVRHGGRDGAPKLVTYPVNDYGTGLIAAYGVALALLERGRSGVGQQVDTGLSLTAGLLQSPYFLDYKGYERHDPEGLSLRGFSALSRLYEAGDAWLYLHCAGEESWGRLCKVADFSALATDVRFATAAARVENDDGLTAALAGVFAKRWRGEWIAMLTAVGVSASPNLRTEDFPDNPYLRSAGLIVTRDHPGLGSADHVAPAGMLSSTPARLGAPAPQAGGNTRAILSELGYGAGRIAALEKDGIVVQAQT